MQQRRLGRTGPTVSVIGFGSFKIGRNQKTKYVRHYELPDVEATDRLLAQILDEGVSYFDTAPAYGLAEERIGHALSHRRREFVLSTKVGETFTDGVSSYDYSAAAVRASVLRSLRLLRTDALDIVLIHSDGDDLRILNETDCVPTLMDLKAEGLVGAIGLSAKSAEGVRQSLAWADVVMVEYHLEDRAQETTLAEASEHGVGVIVKKGLASGRLPADEAIRFVLSNANVGSLVVGGLNIEHLRANIAAAERACRDSAA